MVADVVADALSRKAYCNNLRIAEAQPQLHEEFAKLNLEVVPQDFLANLEIKSSLDDQIKDGQEHCIEVAEIRRTLVVKRPNVSLWMIRVSSILVLVW